MNPLQRMRPESRDWRCCRTGCVSCPAHHTRQDKYNCFSRHKKHFDEIELNEPLFKRLIWSTLLIFKRYAVEGGIILLS